MLPPVRGDALQCAAPPPAEEVRTALCTGSGGTYSPVNRKWRYVQIGELRKSVKHVFLDALDPVPRDVAAKSVCVREVCVE